MRGGPLAHLSCSARPRRRIDACPPQRARGGGMKRFATVLATFGAAGLVLAIVPIAGSESTPWSASVAFANVVASSPTAGGGYPVPAGSRVPEAGTCRAGPFDANHSESWIAAKPGTEDLVGSAKYFFDKYSTFYMFYLGALQISDGTPSGNNQIQGYA